MNFTRRFLSTLKKTKNLEKNIKDNLSNKKIDFDSFINNEKNRKLVELLRKNWHKEALENSKKN